MAVRSRFAPRVPNAPSGRKLSTVVVNDMRGLNSTDPYGILKNSASPYLRNARMYDASDNRQTAISTRTGTEFYTVPIGEAVRDSEESVTGAATVGISSVAWLAQKFTPSATSALTRVDIKVGSDTGTSPIAVEIYTNDSGVPGTLLAMTTIPNSDVDAVADYVTCRFVEAPTVTISTDYWLVVYVQQSESDTYLLSTTTNGTDALTSPNAGNSWAITTYNINFRAYGATGGGVLGAFRYYPSNSQNETLFAHNTDIYKVDDSNGTTTSVASSLSANQSKIRFAQFDDAVFAVNGFDSMKKYTGTTFADVTELASVPSHVIGHKNRLFVVNASDKNRLEFCELADTETWEGTAFIYVPEPKSSDPITALVSFQDTLVVFTKNNKYVLYGSDLGDFTVRQSLGQKGAVSQEAVVADENYVYFVNDDGHLYRWNGSKDEQLSRVIESDFDDIANIEEARLGLYEDRVYYYFQNTGTTSFQSNFIYETRYEEWFYDTGRNVLGNLVFTQDNDELVFMSDRVGAMYRRSDGFSDLGRPIEFEYRSNYYDFGAPDNFKQVRRLYLQFRKVDWAGTITVGSDADFRDDPVTEEVSLQQSGYLWGDNRIEWGDSEIFWGSSDQYLRHRMTVPGQITHFQVRVKKTGANTPVYFLGYSPHYRNRRAA